MKLSLIFALIDITILVAYPFVFLAGKMRQLLKIKISLDEGFLGGVFGPVKIAQQRIAITHRHVLEATHKSVIGIRIAALGTDHK